MKKTLALLLALVTILSLFTVAFAASDVTPVIVVSGMGVFPLSDAETGEEVWPVKSESILNIVKKNVIPLTKFLVTKDWQNLGDELIGDVYSELFETVACDDKGESVKNIEIPTFLKSIDNYPDAFAGADDNVSERGIIKSVAKTIGAENVYFFNYDWRLSPMKHADDLNAFIENVKKEKGAGKVTLIPCSMGGTVTNAYLYKYGNDSIEKIIYTMAAFQGLSSVGEVFQRNIDVDVSTIMSYIFSIQKDDLMMEILMALVNTVVEIAPSLTKLADDFIDESLTELNDRIYDELMLKSLGTFTGWWALVPDEYYDSAKDVFFAGNIPKSFERVIDSYHYNVHRNAGKIMQNAAMSGTDIYVIASYGFVGAPYTNQAMEQTDGLIETHHQSGRATTAPYGKTLGKDYEALGSVCSDKTHNHISTDGIIDASTCFFPDNTWFIKYNHHVGVPCDTDCEKLMLYLVCADDYVTVRSDENYPQFVEFDKLTGKCTSLTGNEIKADIKDGENNFLTRLFVIADTLIRNVKKLVASI